LTHFCCKCCNTDLKGGLALVRRHAASTKHKKNAEATKNCSIATIEDLSSLTLVLREIEVGMCFYLIEHDESLYSSDHLVALFKSAYQKLHPDSLKVRSLTCNREKAAKIVQNVIGSEGERRIILKMKSSIFSLLIDESTDITSTKLLSVVIRSVSDDFQVTYEFACLLEVTDCSAKGLYQAIRKWFIDREVPYTKNVISIGADNASVMVGEKESVAALFQK